MTEREFPKPEIKKPQADTLATLLSNAENIEALHGKEFAEVFSSDESIRSFIEELDVGTFVELLNSINGIIQDKDKKDWGMAKGSVPITMDEGIRGSGYTPPPAQDRQMLFAEVLEAMKKMVKDERSLEDTAIMLSSSVNAIHAYTDANGRTSRLLYLLLTKGLNEGTEPVIKQALSEGGRDIVDINPEKIEGELQSALIQRIHPKRPGGTIESKKKGKDIVFNEILSDELRSELLEMLADSTYSSIALHRYLDDKPDAEKYLKNYPEGEAKWGGQSKILPERNNIMVEALFRDLDETQAREILSIYRQTKAEMVRILIDSAVHSDNKEYTDTDGTTILERFRQKIKRDSEIE
ncbi:Fic family protein [bacterium]|nr:Fic family protein [bacterium]MBU1862987.1 Fic family protein [Candidatus Omnitrophota bacterium]